MDELIRLPEPTLLFGYNQAMEDPRDGLTLFGPLDEGKPYGVRAGVIGSRESIDRFKRWVQQIQQPISSKPPYPFRPPFPGFEAAFNIPFDPKPRVEIEVPDKELNDSLFLDDKYQRAFHTVEVYAKRIIKHIKEEEVEVDIWFVVIPEEVYRYCRPQSVVSADLRIKAEGKMSLKRAKGFQNTLSMFEDENVDSIPYQYEVNFHNQLKARLLEHETLSQVIRETTIAPDDFLNSRGYRIRKVDAPSTIAWNLVTSAFYKAGGRPWKLNGIREGVCYIGLVFKQDERNADPRSACCAAQMFLDSGDGIVFKGDVGPWYNPERGDYHLKYKAARELVETAVKTYSEKLGNPPKELFLHGKVRFDNDEWLGFRDAVSDSTNIVGIRIRDDKDLKLYRKGKYPVLRGLAYVRDERTSFLWTEGFAPRLQSWIGKEVPKPLLIDVNRGKADIQIVLSDIMALTKLNYNSCMLADGMPVTLRFAEAVGEILTAGPIKGIPPLPFKHYI
jgi:hypothetical protein